MVSSPRKCPGVEGKVCGRFLPSKEHDPHRLCVVCGEILHFDDRCEECHDWLDEQCKRVADYFEKLSLQCERKKERKTESSSSSFFSFPSMPKPLGQLPSPVSSGVVTMLAFCLRCVR